VTDLQAGAAVRHELAPMRKPGGDPVKRHVAELARRAGPAGERPCTTV
jgi:hypothetical protein